MKCVYLRTNLVNGKQYVGQANDFINREYEWKCLKGSYAGSLINRAREKYGLENWSVEILVECSTQEELNKWEIFYIDKLNTKTPNGYNLTDGGEGVSGFKHSNETKKKLSVSHLGLNKGIPRSEDVKRKISETKRGIRTSLGMTGHHHSDESKKKMSKARKGKSSPSAKKVYQYLNGELVGVYNSATEAITANGYHYSGALPAACCGKYNKEGNHTYNGYEWYYHKL